MGHYLVVVRELVYLYNPESYAGGSLVLPAGVTMPDWSKGRDQTKNDPWSSRLGVGRGANNPTP